MQTAKVFKCGNSEAIRLPKDFRFKNKEVYIKKIGSCIIIYPKDDVWASFLASLDKFSDDFMQEYKQDSLEKREDLFL